MDNSINGREIKEVVLDEGKSFGPTKTQSLLRLADETEELFAQAVEYRAKLNESKTSVARNLYAKKLKKIVAKLDRHMAAYSLLEKLKSNTVEKAEDQ